MKYRRFVAATYYIRFFDKYLTKKKKIEFRNGIVHDESAESVSVREKLVNCNFKISSTFVCKSAAFNNDTYKLNHTFLNQSKYITIQVHLILIYVLEILKQFILVQFSRIR